MIRMIATANCSITNNLLAEKSIVQPDKDAAMLQDAVWLVHDVFFNLRNHPDAREIVKARLQIIDEGRNFTDDHIVEMYVTWRNIKSLSQLVVYFGYTEHLVVEELEDLLANWDIDESGD